jgi:hypothetical protein
MFHPCIGWTWNHQNYNWKKKQVPLAWHSCFMGK